MNQQRHHPCTAFDPKLIKLGFCVCVCGPVCKCICVSACSHLCIWICLCACAFMSSFLWVLIRLSSRCNACVRTPSPSLSVVFICLHSHERHRGRVCMCVCTCAFVHVSLRMSHLCQRSISPGHRPAEEKLIMPADAGSMAQRLWAGTEILRDSYLRTPSPHKILPLCSAVESLEGKG